MVEIKPGDKAYIEVEITSVRRKNVEARILNGTGNDGYVFPSLEALLPAPQPDDDAIERAAEVIYDTWIDNGDCGRPNWVTEAAKADARDQARALAAAGLLASPREVAPWVPAGQVTDTEGTDQS